MKKLDKMLLPIITFFSVSTLIFGGLLWNSEFRTRDFENCEMELGWCLEKLREKRQLEEIVESLIRLEVEKRGYVDWADLTARFDSASDRSSISFVGDSVQDAEFIGFRVDNRNFFTPFVSVPGASNGIFITGVTLGIPGEIGLHERGSDIKWLKFE